MPGPTNSIDDLPAPVFPLQFRLRHLFLFTTAVAALCGLVAWLGWERMFYVSLAGAPIITLICLTRTNGDRPDWAVRIGGILPAVTSAGDYVAQLSHVNTYVSATTPTPFLAAGAVVAAVGVAVLGVLVSLPFLVLWYAARRIRRTCSRQNDSPAP